MKSSVRFDKLFSSLSADTKADAARSEIPVFLFNKKIIQQKTIWAFNLMFIELSGKARI